MKRMKANTPTPPQIRSIARSVLRLGFPPIALSLTLMCLTPSRRAEGALGPNDTAYGDFALAHENGGNYNSAFGVFALFVNTTGSYNTATGEEALNSNTSGTLNTASGWQALYSNTTGFYNTASGSFA